jgi:Cu/Ag efflux protein CusF
VRIRTLIGLSAAAALAVVLVTPATVSAQTAPPTPQAQSQPPAPADQARATQPRSPVEGELVSVDADAKKITIKPETGANLVITYTDKTEISGAQKDAAGLATMKDARVTVHFTEDAQTKGRTATRIIVETKK